MCPDTCRCWDESGASQCCLPQIDEYAAGTPTTAMPRLEAIATSRSLNLAVGIPETALRNQRREP